MFLLEFQVRDYECDMQSIVNNSVYQNYFEHARHEYLKHKGYNFKDITKSGISLVIYRAELDYRKPLKSGHSFQVTIEVERLSKTRCIFNQAIIRNDKIYTTGKFFITGIDSNLKPINLDNVDINNLVSNT